MSLLSTVQEWAAEFMRGRESLEDDPRSGHPATATTEENIVPVPPYTQGRI